MSDLAAIHVKSDVTGLLRCGRRGAAITISSSEYIAWLGMSKTGMVGENIRLRFGETARLCRRCARAA